MIIIMKPKAANSSIEAVSKYIKDSGLEVHLSQGAEVTIIGVVGNKSLLSSDTIAIMKDVERIVPVTESYKLSNKKFQPESSIVKVGVISAFSTSSFTISDTRFPIDFSLDDTIQ